MELLLLDTDMVRVKPLVHYVPQNSEANVDENKMVGRATVVEAKRDQPCDR